MSPAAPAGLARPPAAGPRAQRSPWWPAAIAMCALLAAFNLLAGASGGLARLGLPVPAAALGLHGAVMACGFFGTLIALERAVALRQLAGMIAPLAAGLGGPLAWMLHTTPAAQAAWGLAAVALIALYLMAGLTRAWSLPLAIELAAALCWAAGTAAWVGGGLAAAVPGWMAFLVLTIAAERRELTQMVRLPTFARRVFLLVVGSTTLMRRSIRPWHAPSPTTSVRTRTSRSPPQHSSRPVSRSCRRAGSCRRRTSGVRSAPRRSGGGPSRSATAGIATTLARRRSSTSGACSSR